MGKVHRNRELEKLIAERDRFQAERDKLHRELRELEAWYHTRCDWYNKTVWELREKCNALEDRLSKS
jgi:chromosome segregation ATPase